MITFDDFKKMEIKIGRIVSAEKVENADRLLKLEVDLGESKRQVVAGIALQYKPEEIIGREVVVLVNLEPRNIRGVESQGMVLAAVDRENPVLLHPGREVPLGSIVR